MKKTLKLALLLVLVSVALASDEIPVAALNAALPQVYSLQTQTIDASSSTDPDGGGGINGITRFEFNYGSVEGCYEESGDNTCDGNFDGVTSFIPMVNSTSLVPSASPYTASVEVTDEELDTDSTGANYYVLSTYKTHSQSYGARSRR